MSRENRNESNTGGNDESHRMNMRNHLNRSETKERQSEQGARSHSQQKNTRKKIV